MTTTAKSIIKDAVTIAQDVTSVRWKIDEVCSFFNWAQKEVVSYRPDASQVRANIPIVAGAKQTLPVGATKLIDIHADANGRSVRLVNRELLDAQVPTWRATSAPAPKHFMYDPRTPTAFEIYPSASGSTTVDGSYATLPANIGIATAGGTYEDVVGDLGVPDQFAGAVLDLILFRMYNKDAEYAGNAEMAKAHLASAANSLGVEIKGTISIAPTSPGNPNHPGASRAVA